MSYRRRPLAVGRQRYDSRVDYPAFNRAALAVLPILLARWLPGGKFEGKEYVAINPKRIDHRPGSFRVNVQTGKWADFAIDGARGHDPVSLAAYLAGISQIDAAHLLATMLSRSDFHGSR
jgi:hypothetical protein